MECLHSRSCLRWGCVVSSPAPGVINHHPVGAGLQSWQSMKKAPLSGSFFYAGRLCPLGQREGRLPRLWVQKGPRKSGAFSLHNFSSIAQRGSAIRVRRLAAYFLAMAATSAAKSSSLLARPSPFSKRTKFLMEMVPPSSLALASTYLETEVLFSLTKA